MLEQYIPYYDVPYVKAFTVFLLFFILSKFLLFIIEKIVLRITKKTETEIDDLIAEKSKNPLSLLMVVIGLKIAMFSFSFSEKISFIIQKSIETIIIIILSVLFVRIFNVVIKSWGTKFTTRTKSSIDDQLLIMLYRSSSIIFLVTGILIVLSNWGIEIGPLIASLGIGGIAVAFALQSSLGNIFGGISLIIDKNIKVGDVVWIDDITTGRIIDIGFRSTKVRSFDNETFIIPNGLLSNTTFKNIAQPSKDVRIVIPFGVAYGSDLDKVRKLVLKELKKIKSLQKEPEPHVKFLEMGESSLNFNAYFYISDYNERLVSKDEANSRIYNILVKNNIEIPFPQRDVHIKK